MVVNLFFNTVSLSQSPFEKYLKIFHVPLTSKTHLEVLQVQVKWTETAKNMWALHLTAS